MNYKLTTISKKLLADTLTPVNIYLKLRDVFACSILLESSDYHGHENSLSFICCEPLASFQVKGTEVEMRLPDGKVKKEQISRTGQAVQYLEEFKAQFECDQPGVKYVNCGLFGYIAYDAVRFFEDVAIDQRDAVIPDILYKLYRYVIIVDHFSNELTLCENSVQGVASGKDGLNKIEQIIFSNRFATYKFT